LKSFNCPRPFAFFVQIAQLHGLIFARIVYGFEMLEGVKYAGSIASCLNKNNTQAKKLRRTPMTMSDVKPLAIGDKPIAITESALTEQSLSLNASTDSLTPLD